MEQKVRQFAGSAKLHRITDPISKPEPLEGVSLEARLKDARKKRMRVLAEKENPRGNSEASEDDGTIQFAPPPFQRDDALTADRFPFPGAEIPFVLPGAIVEDAGPVLPPLGDPDPVQPAEPDLPVAAPRKQTFVNPKIGEASSEPAEVVDSSTWAAGPNDDVFINPKIVESMLPYVPYPVSGNDDPWFSVSARSKLKRNSRRVPRIDRSNFIPSGENFDLGTPVELKAVFDEVTHIHLRRRKKVRLARILAVVAIIVSLAMLLPILKGGFQPAMEALLLTAPAH